MSCFDIYRDHYNGIDEHKPLGTLADDVTGEGCILPRHLIKMYNDKVPSTREFISGVNCSIKNTDNQNESHLTPDDNGCRLKLSDMRKDQANNVLANLQSIYDKNVIDRIEELKLERNKRRTAYRNTRRNFNNLNVQLSNVVRDYQLKVAESNFLQREKRQLQNEQQRESEQLKTVLAEIEAAKESARAETTNLQTIVKTADDFLNFVCMIQHCDYQGVKNTYTPGYYSPLRNVQGVSSFVIPPGMQVKIYTELNYNGQNATLEFGDHDTKRCLVKQQYQHTDTKFRGKIPFEFTETKTFNDNVKSIEVQKIDSVLKYVDDWTGKI